jgi:hypothetical protein
MLLIYTLAPMFTLQNTAYASSEPSTVNVWVDDVDKRIDYQDAGTPWEFEIGGGNESSYAGSSHWTGIAGNAAEFQFQGTSIKWIGTIQTWGSRSADVYLDGVLEATVTQVGATEQRKAVIYEKNGLSDGLHTIRIVSKGSINIDAFQYDSTESVVKVDDFVASESYSGTWERRFVNQWSNEFAPAFNGTAHESKSNGSAFTYTFSGTSVKWIGLRAAWAGTANVSIDGGTAVEVNLNNGQWSYEFGAVLFQRSDLAPGEHTITIEQTSSKAIYVDAIEFTASGAGGGGGDPDPGDPGDPGEEPELPNLIVNGGFEQDLTGWSGWASSVTIAQDAAYEGAKSLKASPGQGGMQFIPLKPGTAYKLSFYAKGGGASASVGISYTKQGGNGPTDYGDKVGFQGSDTDFTYKELLFATAYEMVPGAYNGFVSVYNHQDADLYIDRLVLTELTDPFVPDTMLRNASFEKGIEHWTRWNESGSRVTTSTYSGGTASLEVDQFHGGMQFINLQPGATYKLEVHGKTQGGGTPGTGTVALNYTLPGETEIGDRGLSIVFGSQDSDFVRKELVFDTPFDMVTGEQKALVQYYNEGASKLYLDDFTLTKIADLDPYAKLASLVIDGTELNGFEPSKNSYYVELPFGETDIPVVSAASSDGEVEVVHASTLPGSSVVSVRNDAGFTNNYYVHFSLSGDQIVSESFNDGVVSSAPEGWLDRGRGEYQIAAVDNDNRLRMKHTSSGTGGLEKTFAPQAGKFTLSFKMRNTDQGTFPSVNLVDSTTGLTALNIAEAWAVKYNLSNLDDTESGRNLVDGLLKLGEWRTYTAVIDVPSQTFDLYVEGNEGTTGSALNVPFLQEVTGIDTIAIKHTSWALNGETYIDDVMIQQAPSMPNHVTNGDFSNGLTHWSIEGADAELTNAFGSGRISIPPGNGAAMVSLQDARLAAGKSYMLQFAMRGSEARAVNVGIYGNASMGGTLLKSQAFQASTETNVFRMVLQAEEGTAFLHDSRITFAISSGSEPWTGKLDNVLLLPLESNLPEADAAETFAIENVQITDGGSSIEGLPYTLNNFKLVQADFYNETVGAPNVTYHMELVNGDGEQMQQVSITGAAVPSGKQTLNAGFMIPDGATTVKVRIYVLHESDQSAYSTIVELPIT